MIRALALLFFPIAALAADLPPPLPVPVIPAPSSLETTKVGNLWLWSQQALATDAILRAIIAGLETEISNLKSGISDPIGEPSPMDPGYYRMVWRFHRIQPLPPPGRDTLYYWEVVRVTKEEYESAAWPEDIPDPEIPDPESPIPDPVSHIAHPVVTAGGYRVTFPARAPGSYVVEATTLATNQQSDSFWLTINGGARTQWNVPLAPDWQAHIIAPGGTPLLVDGSAVVIDFAQREPAQLQLVRLIPTP